MQRRQPIGIFDSGVGGTSIWKEIVALMPLESTCYLADSKYAPYGNKTARRIRELSIKNTDELVTMGAKIIVVACNTATTNAIAHLRQQYDVPIIGIEPAIKPAALASQTGAIGILATKGTLSSSLFVETSRKYTEHLKVIEVVGEGLVPLIESGNLESVALKTLVKKYVAPMLEANIDHLVLGCSHYPYLIPLLRDILPSEITIIDSGSAVARQTQAVLKEKGFAIRNEVSNPTHHLYSNKSIEPLRQLVADVKTNKQFSYRDF